MGWRRGGGLEAGRRGAGTQSTKGRAVCPLGSISLARTGNVVHGEPDALRAGRSHVLDVRRHDRLESRLADARGGARQQEEPKGRRRVAEKVGGARARHRQHPHGEAGGEELERGSLVEHVAKYQRGDRQHADERAEDHAEPGLLLRLWQVERALDEGGELDGRASHDAAVHIVDQIDDQEEAQDDLTAHARRHRVRCAHSARGLWWMMELVRSKRLLACLSALSFHTVSLAPRRARARGARVFTVRIPTCTCMYMSCSYTAQTFERRSRGPMGRPAPSRVACPLSGDTRAHAHGPASSVAIWAPRTHAACMGRPTDRQTAQR